MTILQTDPSLAMNMSPEAADTLSAGFGEFDPSIAAEFGYEIADTVSFVYNQ